MKYFVILLAGFVFSVASAQYQGDVEFYYLPVETDSKQYSILSQSITNKFVGVFYDDKAGSLIFSISKSADLIDSAAITMNQHSLSELFSSGKTQDPNNMLVLINGEEQPYKTVKDKGVVSWVFQIPPNSDEIELIPSSERFGVGNYQLEDVTNNLPKTYLPLKQEHIGITHNEIQCRDFLALVIKYDNSPACVKEQTKEKLIEREWIKSECAHLFDSNMNEYSSHVKEQKEKGVVWTPPTAEGLVSKSDFFREWRDHGCHDTVMDWKELSDNTRFLNGLDLDIRK